MIYVTQLVYLNEGQEQAFHQFEDVVIPLIETYNGTLLLRLRPTPETYVSGSLELPYEVHFVSFPTQADLDAFKRDKTREGVLHLKDASVSRVVQVQGIN
ncbi:DUF1330 domain-containing protein [Fulvivirgaceae bacterium PWU5]|uniref:DUF1330 domain-containing protein n=1 Tax=Dawidia cretensis TaxID=2782350 RepID=A0AAP2DXT7_9BACT|nr:DUF1330 domain-containing protein [Dawidia cretensis]MBT1707734.1 DUF1330 domain-containing protein [Dawidia cretensis]